MPLWGKSWRNGQTICSESNIPWAETSQETLAPWGPTKANWEVLISGGVSGAPALPPIPRFGVPKSTPGPGPAIPAGWLGCERSGLPVVYGPKVCSLHPTSMAIMQSEKNIVNQVLILYPYLTPSKNYASCSCDLILFYCMQYKPNRKNFSISIWGISEIFAKFSQIFWNSVCKSLGLRL